MHASLERQFVNAFPNILLQAKTDALIPIVKLFLGQIEKYGFSLEEILLVLSVELGDLDRASSLLWEAAKCTNPTLEDTNLGV